ncbi:MAG: hypothetical protein COA96_06360 [SAR86 cluster bacterium]|uniref:Uncharacterized protein n=1 Tax=SAR86 cluster bacterium TaxID=2030880 RepID=A0A2A5B480_9GAMM|nr:MAG: hypothetical protein COA96_06360 [SAR86 cluster bacterium]
MKRYSLNEIAQLAEVVAAISVVASLIWVAVELRLNSDEIQNANSMQLTTFTAEKQLEAIGLGVASLIIKAQSEEELTPTEMTNLTFYFRYMLQEFETAHFQFVQGRLDSQLAASWDRRLSVIIGAPLGIDYWDREKSLYTQRFQSHVDALISREESSAAETYQSVQ